MIKYALGCAEGHEFESWFPDSAAYEKLRKRELVACPECGSVRGRQGDHGAGGGRGPSAHGRSPPRSSSTTSAARRATMIARLRHEIEANTVDVGARFPEWRARSTTATSPSGRSAGRRASTKPRP